MLIRRPSPSLLVAAVALVVGASGVSYAAVDLTRNSVKAKHIAPNAVGSSEIKSGAVRGEEVKDGSLTTVDFAAGQLPVGPAGAKGETGAKGDRGDAGPYPTTLPSGMSETGVFAMLGHGNVSNGLEIASGDISFTFPLATAPQARVVQLGTTSSGPECPGTANAPAAAPGWLCVYENREQNQRPGFGYPSVFAPGSGSSPSASRFGAGLSVQGQSSGTDWFFWSEGTWAVTAP